MRDPLAPPEPNSTVLQTFVDVNRLDPERPRLQLLGELATAFARLPYENLTKILKQANTGSIEEARRLPAEVLSDHVQFGTGGTCFSLTATLLHLVRAQGWQAEPILADRRYGADTHCALLVWIDGQPHLLDPGYLIVHPLTLPRNGELRIPTSFNEVVLTTHGNGDKIDLHTIQNGQKTYRLTFKSGPAESGAFLRAWDASFDWDMMHYPVLSRVVDGRQIYVQKSRHLVRGRNTVERCELDPNALVERIAGDFGIAPEVTARALAVLRRQGDFHVGASGS